MTKPDITLEHSKAVVCDMASRIFAAYIVRGEVKDGEESNWMERSIREAVKIAKTINASIESEKTPYQMKKPLSLKKHAHPRLLQKVLKVPQM